MAAPLKSRDSAELLNGTDFVCVTFFSFLDFVKGFLAVLPRADAEASHRASLTLPLHERECTLTHGGENYRCTL